MFAFSSLTHTFSLSGWHLAELKIYSWYSNCRRFSSTLWLWDEVTFFMFILFSHTAHSRENDVSCEVRFQADFTVWGLGWLFWLNTLKGFSACFWESWNERCCWWDAEIEIRWSLNLFAVRPHTERKKQKFSQQWHRIFNKKRKKFSISLRALVVPDDKLPNPFQIPAKRSIESILSAHKFHHSTCNIKKLLLSIIIVRRDEENVQARKKR